MSGQHTTADGTDDYTVQQENELEALASIFGDDFQDLRNNDPWKVRRLKGVSFVLQWADDACDLTYAITTCT